MHKSTNKMKLSIFLLHTQSCIFNICDLRGPSLSLVSCDSAGCESTWFFSLRSFSGFIYSELTLSYWISAYFPSLWDCRVQARPPLPVLQPSVDSPSHAEAYLPQPNCLKGGGQGQHVCSGCCTCLLKHLSSGGKKERKCTAWSCLLAISLQRDALSLQSILHSFLKLIPNKTHQWMQFLKHW